MKTVGIAAEYNPFHRGHAGLVRYADAVWMIRIGMDKRLRKPVAVFQQPGGTLHPEGFTVPVCIGQPPVIPRIPQQIETGRHFRPLFLQFLLRVQPELILCIGFLREQLRGHGFP